MRYLALATDYDGTIAHDGVVDAPTLAALRRVRDSGRRLILVTGRELDDLFDTFAHCDVFDRAAPADEVITAGEPLHPGLFWRGKDKIVWRELSLHQTNPSRDHLPFDNRPPAC